MFKSIYYINANLAALCMLYMILCKENFANIHELIETIHECIANVHEQFTNARDALLIAYFGLSVFCIQFGNCETYIGHKSSTNVHG